MKAAIYPGSFDPMTLGHLDVIRRASKMFDTLIVSVLDNKAKNALFSVEERVSILKEATKDLPNVQVDSFQGLLIDYARQKDIHVSVRGLRAITDFEYELQIAQTNSKLSNGMLDTVFLTTSLEYAYLSSSSVKEIASFHGDISQCVPDFVAKLVYEKYKDNSNHRLIKSDKYGGVLCKSRIEQLIDEIEAYIDNCKYKAFSTDVIMVNKAEIDELLRELRMKTPEEIKQYQRIISNREAILDDAKQKAKELIDNATVQTNELISEHQIMQQAYAQANEIVELATKQAQEILDNATTEANNVKIAAMQYTDDILANLGNIITHSIEVSTNDYNTMLANLRQIDSIVSANRAELNPPVEETNTAPEGETEKLDVI